MNHRSLMYRTSVLIIFERIHTTWSVKAQKWRSKQRPQKMLMRSTDCSRSRTYRCSICLLALVWQHAAAGSSRSLSPTTSGRPPPAEVSFAVQFLPRPPTRNKETSPKIPATQPASTLLRQWEARARRQQLPWPWLRPPQSHQHMILTLKKCEMISFLCL